MNRKPLRLAIAALALGSASVAYAGDTEDFAACDGLKKPKRSDDGMRGVATISGFNPFSSMFGKPDRKSASKVAACDIALAHKKLLPTQTLRRAHLLRARAAARIDLGQFDSALADITQAKALVAEQNGDPFFVRSMGVSLDLMSALANAGLGDMEEAARAAQLASAKRPYALQVQTVAWRLNRLADRPGGDWLMKLEPQAVPQVLLAEYKAGNFAAVRELAEGDSITLQSPAVGSGGPVFAAPKLDERFLGAIAATLAAAYSDAALGAHDSARERVATVRSHLGMDLEEEGADGVMGKATRLIADRIAIPLIALTEARLALAEHGPKAALDIVSGVRLPMGAATTDLFDAMREEAHGVDGLAIPDMGPEPVRREATGLASGQMGDLAEMLLIAPEAGGKLIDYKKSRPNILGALIGGALSMGTSLLGGIDRLSGFRSEQQGDGTLKVEYVGNTTSGPVVQEMTLLRAAELAQEAGSPRFAIVDRRDYQRYIARTQYGVEQSRTLSGYKTELIVRLLDDTEPAPTAFETVAVIDDLGPLYYGEG